MQKIFIEKKEYKIIDAREYMTIPDCFVSKNKIGTGHGEAKFYVGNENKETLGFFDKFTRKCMLLKSDLLKYLEDAKSEYKHPEQEYKNKKDLPDNWDKNIKDVQGLSEAVIMFNMFRVKVEPPRIYINSSDNIYSLLREIALPQISYLSVLKLRSDKGETIYYFRPFIDYYYFGDEDHPSIIKEKQKEIADNISISATEREQIIKSRIGQGQFRESLLQELPACIITGVSDERILVASHIKPWAKSDNIEKLHSKNGLTLTPTYDRLFDRGFISFEDNGLLMVSPWISPMNQKRLFLSPGKKYAFNIIGREIYLKYHREEVFNK